MRPPSAAVAACCGCRASLTPATVGPDWQTADHDALDRPDLLLLGLHEYTKSGIGRTSLASTEKYKIIGDRQDHRGGSGTRHDARLFDSQTSAALSLSMRPEPVERPPEPRLRKASGGDGATLCLRPSSSLRRLYLPQMRGNGAASGVAALGQFHGISHYKPSDSALRM
jgi:hypothetical protein